MHSRSWNPYVPRIAGAHMFFLRLWSWRGMRNTTCEEACSVSRDGKGTLSFSWRYVYVNTFVVAPAPKVLYGTQMWCGAMKTLPKQCHVWVVCAIDQLDGCPQTECLKSVLHIRSGCEPRRGRCDRASPPCMYYAKRRFEVFQSVSSLLL